MPDRAAQLQQHRRVEEERAARARERAQALLKASHAPGSLKVRAKAEEVGEVRCPGIVLARNGRREHCIGGEVSVRMR